MGYKPIKHEKKCVICGIIFTTTNSIKNTCSKKCALKNKSIRDATRIKRNRAAGKMTTPQKCDMKQKFEMMEKGPFIKVLIKEFSYEENQAEKKYKEIRQAYMQNEQTTWTF